MRLSEIVQPLTRGQPVSRGLAVVAVVVALSSSACLAPGPAGLRNGFYPDSVLTTINSQCQIWTPAAPSLQRLMWSALTNGIVLTPISCYRSYAQQVAVRNYWCSLGLCQYAAVPGTSTHGIGRAVDFADQSGALTFFSPGYVWLKTFAGMFCFYHPAFAEPTGVAPEPWHWQWACG